MFNGVGIYTFTDQTTFIGVFVDNVLESNLDVDVDDPNVLR